MQQIVVLVHGTHGRGMFVRRPVAAWAMEGSPMRSAIQTQLGVDNVAFECFPWSGSNNIRARTAATNELVDFLLALLERHPTSRVHLVAHSHGGNVVMYAMRTKLIRDRIASITCLSTPFLHARPRYFGAQLGTRILLASATGLLLLALVLCSLLVQWKYPHFWAIVAELARGLGGTAHDAIDRLLGFLHLSWLRDPKPPGMNPVQMWRLLGAAAAVIVTFAATIVPLLERWHKRAASIAEDMRLPNDLAVPLLIVRNPGDEASSALGGAQVLSGFMTRIFGVLATAFPPQLDLNKATNADLYVAPLSLLIAVPLVPLLALMALPMLPFFGFDAALACLTLQLSAEATPPGHWQVAQLPWDDVPFEGWSRLSHATHGDPRAIELTSGIIARHAADC